jgi:hypothetical protein
LSRTAHEWYWPAEIFAAVRPEIAPPDTRTGVGELVADPFPSCPKALYPQQATEPLSRTAHEWWSPAEIFAAVRPEIAPPDTRTGVGEFVFDPSPSCP